jgi:hypothetical protein
MDIAIECIPHFGDPRRDDLFVFFSNQNNAIFVALGC